MYIYINECIAYLKTVIYLYVHIYIIHYICTYVYSVHICTYRYSIWLLKKPRSKAVAKKFLVCFL